MNKRYDQEAAVRYPLSAIRYPLSAIRCRLSAFRCPLTAVCLSLSAFPPATVILSEAKDLGKNCI